MDGKSQPLIVAMKGHPGSGKSTLARAISAALRCPLLDKDDVRDCTLSVQLALSAAVPSEPSSPPASSLLNDLSYSVLWRLTQTQLELGLAAVVVDSPLSRRAHLDRLVELAVRHAGRVVIVECRPGDEAEWCRRLEARGTAYAAADGGSEGWHKPRTWEELRRLVEGYGGSTDYDVGDVPRLILDTTAPAAAAGVDKVVDFIKLQAKNHLVNASLYY